MFLQKIEGEQTSPSLNICKFTTGDDDVQASDVDLGISQGTLSFDMSHELSPDGRALLERLHV